MFVFNRVKTHFAKHQLRKVAACWWPTCGQGRRAEQLRVAFYGQTGSRHTACGQKQHRFSLPTARVASGLAGLAASKAAHRHHKAADCVSIWALKLLLGGEVAGAYQGQ